MKHFFPLFVLLISTIAVKAQTDSTAFRCYLENKELEVYMNINFHGQDVSVPGQDYYGKVPGFLGKTNNPFCWIIVDAQVKSDTEAELTMVNDYGSEDLTARLERKNDSLYVLRQGTGSSIKVPRKGKWFKLPQTIRFVRVGRR